MDEDRDRSHENLFGDDEPEIPEEFFGEALLELQNDPDHNLLGQCIAAEKSFDKGKGKYVGLRAYRLYVMDIKVRVRRERRERREMEKRREQGFKTLDKRSNFAIVKYLERIDREGSLRVEYFLASLEEAYPTS
jgi:hypothetical protein